MKKKLKQELKNQGELKRKANNRKAWLLFFLLIILLGIIGLPYVQDYRLTLPMRLLAKGVEYESLGQLDLAEQTYVKLKQRYPHTPAAEEALFRMGRIWQDDRKDMPQALLTYLQLEHDYPESTYVLPARQEAAWIVKYAQRDYSAAIGYYQHLLELDKDNADRYLYEIADCYFRLENYPQARIELETLLEDYPHSELTADALYRRGGILVLENRPEAAKQSWKQLIDRFPDSSYRSQAEFNLARMFEEEGLLQEALDLYRKLTDFPRPSLLQEKIKHLEQRIEKKSKAI